MMILLIFFVGVAVGWAVCSLMVAAKKGDEE